MALIKHVHQGRLDDFGAISDTGVMLRYLLLLALYLWLFFYNHMRIRFGLDLLKEVGGFLIPF